MSENFANNASTTLNGTINNSTTSVVVTSAAGFPSANFRILIGSELMLVTGVSGTTFTVTRGIEGTGAASHSSGVQVTQIITAGGLLQYITENAAPAGPTTSYTQSNFTVLNTHGETITDQTGAILLSIPARTANFQAILLSRPIPTAKVEAAFDLMAAVASATDLRFMFGYRESATGKMTLMGLFSSGEFAVRHHSAFTDEGTAIVTAGRHIGSNPRFLKVEKSGSNLLFSISVDGLLWSQIWTETLTTYFTTAPDQVVWGAGVWSAGSSEASVQMKLMQWNES
jgi:hypothetical protein